MHLAGAGVELQNQEDATERYKLLQSINLAQFAGGSDKAVAKDGLSRRRSHGIGH